MFTGLRDVASLHLSYKLFKTNDKLMKKIFLLEEKKVDQRVLTDDEENFSRDINSASAALQNINQHLQTVDGLQSEESNLLS